MVLFYPEQILLHYPQIVLEGPVTVKKSPYMDRIKDNASVQQQPCSQEILRDPLVVQFAQNEVESIMRDVDLRVLVERLANKYNISREKARKAVMSVLRAMLGA